MSVPSYMSHKMDPCHLYPQDTNSKLDAFFYKGTYVNNNDKEMLIKKHKRKNKSNCLQSIKVFML